MISISASLQDHLGSAARHTKALVTRHSLRERYKTSHTYLAKLKGLCEDVSAAVTSLTSLTFVLFLLIFVHAYNYIRKDLIIFTVSLGK